MGNLCNLDVDSAVNPQPSPNGPAFFFDGSWPDLSNHAARSWLSADCCPQVISFSPAHDPASGHGHGHDHNHSHTSSLSRARAHYSRPHVNRRAKN
ncbi:hypothetical protein CPAR01_11164 [Colletotrichum paranaense]|uniref:Uncharacterized protein n=1 Tax=Colletotrichum paranaense TaxID=1914294 RepID=A0ABQ9SAU9_9PEZI|nr:uncharacterized protein CPAR01_11164 [Colletotrichum paranaense]KAK1531515.1 hypothetical protein CPAR01_11164 [Colletotrichum paranaense]